MMKRQRKPKERIDPDISHITQSLFSKIMGKAQGTISKLDECPRNPDGTYDPTIAGPWVIEYFSNPSDKADLEKDKLRLQCQKMEIEIEALKAENIPLETHKQIMSGRAMSLKNFIVEFFAKNCHQLAHKSIDQIRPQLQEWAAAMLNHFSSNHK
jgi:hypothetical protein